MSRDRTSDRTPIIWLSLAVAGGIVAAFGYWTDATETVLGSGLAVAFLGTGIGLVTWTRTMDLDHHAVQERDSLAVDDEAGDELDSVITTSAVEFRRRRLLLVLLGGSFASMAVAFIGPIGSLGPKPSGGRQRTAWGRGSKLVTIDGRPVPVDQFGFDELVTVFPEGSVGRDDSQVVLMRIRPELLSERTVAGGAVDGWVAYSKICTHAGCSVGLLGIDDRPPDQTRQLVCPCHQSVFDPSDAAKPRGGPAPRPLPQLPLANEDGILVSTSDFDGPVGPIAWNEG